MGLAISDDDIRKLNAAGDEIIDRAGNAIQNAAKQAISDIHQAADAEVLQLSNVLNGVLQGLQATVDSAVHQAGELLEGWELQVTVPPITIKLTKPK